MALNCKDLSFKRRFEAVCDRDAQQPPATPAARSETIMSRHFENPYPDYSEETGKEYLVETTRSKLSDEFVARIRQYVDSRMYMFEDDLKDDIFNSECVFTGSAGVACVLVNRIKCPRPQEDYRDVLLEAYNYIQVQGHRKPRVSFLCGDAGPFAIGAVISHHLVGFRPKTMPEPSVLAERLMALWDVARQPSTPDEILYGRCGYLFALLYVNRDTGFKYIPDAFIRQVVDAVIESGVQLAGQTNVGKAPLMYEWHDSYYLGAAHGIAGILYMLLQVLVKYGATLLENVWVHYKISQMSACLLMKFVQSGQNPTQPAALNKFHKKAREYISNESLRKYVVPTLDWLLSLRYESGNYPSSIGSRSDKLVQWCHGAPGFVELLCLAHKVFKDNKYMEHAEACGEVIWTRGLCTKGYSLCHGVAGNAYAFLQLYQATKNYKHLYRACCFADWCMQEKPGTELHKPDAPGSLFEGLAGRLYLLTDLLLPMNAKFPGYTV